MAEYNVAFLDRSPLILLNDITLILAYSSCAVSFYDVTRCRVIPNTSQQRVASSCRVVDLQSFFLVHSNSRLPPVAALLVVDSPRVPIEFKVIPDDFFVSLYVVCLRKAHRISAAWSCV